MHSFHHSRSRILFEVFCALAISASCVGAWMQTGAWALLPAAVVAALYGIVHTFDLRRRNSINLVEPQESRAGDRSSGRSPGASWKPASRRWPTMNRRSPSPLRKRNASNQRRHEEARLASAKARQEGRLSRRASGLEQAKVTELAPPLRTPKPAFAHAPRGGRRHPHIRAAVRTRNIRQDDRVRHLAVRPASSSVAFTVQRKRTAQGSCATGERLIEGAYRRLERCAGDANCGGAGDWNAPPEERAMKRGYCDDIEKQTTAND